MRKAFDPPPIEVESYRQNLLILLSQISTDADDAIRVINQLVDAWCDQLVAETTIRQLEFLQELRRVQTNAELRVAYNEKSDSFERDRLREVSLLLNLIVDRVLGQANHENESGTDVGL